MAGWRTTVSRVVVLLGVLAIAQEARADDAARSCLSKVCLGSPLAKVGPAWQERSQDAAASYRRALKHNPYLPDQRRVQFNGLFPSLDGRDMERLLPYKDVETAEEDLLFLLDATSLGIFARTSQVCAYVRLEGRFLSESGYPTTVTYRPVMVEGGNRFVVARLRRDYPIRSEEHKTALLAQLEDRFGPLMPYATAVLEARNGRTGPYYRIDGATLSLTLYDPGRTVVNEWRAFAARLSETYRKQPFCREKRRSVPLD